MTAVPVIRTFVSGEIVLASYFNNNINGPLSWLLAPAICRVRQTGAQSISNATFTAFTFGAEDIDSDNMHSTSVNTSRITAVHPGWYRYGGGGSLATNATGLRGLFWFVNGSVLNASGVLLPAVSGNSTRLAARSDLVYLNVGDYLELQTYQTSGGSLNTGVSTDEQPGASVDWRSN